MLTRVFLITSICISLVFIAAPEAAYENTRKSEAESPLTLNKLNLSQKERDFLETHKTIRVAFDGYFPPYSYLNESGKFEGLAVDVIKLLSDSIGVNIEIYPDGLWKNLYEAAKRKEVDVVATMVERPERRKWFAFTRPYIFKSLVVMTRENGTVIENRRDISGKIIALVRGYQYVPRILKEFPAVRPYYVDTMLDGLNAVATGKADGAITFIGAGDFLKSRYQLANLHFSAVYDKNSSLESIAVRNDWPELASIFDKGIGALDKRLLHLRKKWGSDEYLLATIPAGHVVRKEILIATGVILVLLVAALGGIYTWNRQLKQQVDTRTAELSREIEEHKKDEAELALHRAHLEELVKKRTADLEERTFELEKSQQALRYLIEDVNESRAELQEANKRLKELDRLKSMFIASMSHELRTPLNSIIGFTGITLQGLSGELNEEQRDNLTRAYKAALHLLELITDVIDISKIEAGRIEVFPEEFSLKSLVDEAVETITPQATEKGLSIEKSVDEDLRVYTDRRRLMQCVLNILGNAVKYTEKGGVKIEVTRLTNERAGADHQLSIVNGQLNGDSAEISVTDSGIGIAQEDIPKLFKPFERLQTHLRIKAGGTGLGLYLTKKIMTELLHGTVTFESTPWEGSRFVLRLPVKMKIQDSKFNIQDS